MPAGTASGVSHERAHSQARARRPFGSGDFPAEVLDPVHAAEIVIQRLNDAGFKIESAGN